MSSETTTLENRLSINPNDERWQATLADWEDGAVYDVRLKISQVSPGEFEVLSLAQRGGPASEESAEAEELREMPGKTEGIEQEAGGYQNPAVRRMMMDGFGT